MERYPELSLNDLIVLSTVTHTMTPHEAASQSALAWPAPQFDRAVALFTISSLVERGLLQKNRNDHSVGPTRNGLELATEGFANLDTLKICLQRAISRYTRF